METIRTLVRNLVVILLLAAFLDLLLPSNTMRKFVKLVMGLFVIAAILNPLTAFLHTPLAMEIPAWTTLPSGDLPALANEGEEGSQIGRSAVQEQYRMILIRQIQSLVLGVDGIKQAEVEVTLEKGTGALLDQPRIEGVTITVTREEPGMTPTQPVTVPSVTAGIEDRQRVQLLTERVSTFIGIPADKISVKEK